MSLRIYVADDRDASLRGAFFEMAALSDGALPLLGLNFLGLFFSGSCGAEVLDCEVVGGSIVEPVFPFDATGFDGVVIVFVDFPDDANFAWGAAACAFDLVGSFEDFFASVAVALEILVVLVASLSTGASFGTDDFFGV